MLFRLVCHRKYSKDESAQWRKLFSKGLVWAQRILNANFGKMQIEIASSTIALHIYCTFSCACLQRQSYDCHFCLSCLSFTPSQSSWRPTIAYSCHSSQLGVLEVIAACHSCHSIAAISSKNLFFSSL